MKAEQKLYETDPEFMERFEHFAYEEVVKEEGQTLDEKTRYLAILATLLGCQGLDVFKATLPEALDAGLFRSRTDVRYSLAVLPAPRTRPAPGQTVSTSRLPRG